VDLNRSHHLLHLLLELNLLLQLSLQRSMPWRDVALWLVHLLLQLLEKLEPELQQRVCASLVLLLPRVQLLQQKLLPFRYLLLTYFF
jgi:hypothetical protein